jgi:DNA ligase (NAD+)
METLINKIKKSPDDVISSLKQNKFLKVLDYLNESYYNENVQKVSDQLYDYLKKDYESKYGLITEIGYKEKNNKINLPFYLGSMNKPDDEQQINKWMDIYKGPYNISLKLDGISGLLYKENDELKLTTRGDGYVGVDKSNLIKYINTLPNLKNGEYVRGELIISKTNFLKIADKFKNARNACGGIINSKTINKDLLKLVDFVGYSVIKPEMTISKQMKFIEKKNIQCVENINRDKLIIDEISKILIDNRINNDYNIDGLIITDDSKYYPIVAGENPKYSFAFKQVLTDQMKETMVLDVIWTIQKDKYIYPKLKIIPVDINGTEIKCVNAHHAKFIVENNIGVGSKIIVIRSKDVIPKIHEILTPSETGEPLMPDIECKWDETKTNLIATGLDEDDEENVLIKNLTFIFEKLNVENFSEATIRKFVENGYDSFWKILKADKNDLVKINGLNTKSVEKIYNNIDESLRKIKLHELMYASVCFGRLIGSKKLKLILDEHPNIIDIYKEKGKEFTHELINNIKGFKDKSTNKIIDGMGDFIKWINKLIKLKPFISDLLKIETNIIEDNEYKGKKICFSGFRDDELEKKLTSYGASIVSCVSKNTSLLIVKDINENNSKIIKAKELNIPIIEKHNLNI